MPADLTKTRNFAIAIGATAALVMMITLLLPPFQVIDAAAFPLPYLLIELFTVFISVLVVVVSYHTLTSQQHSDQASLLILGFTVVAACDLAHALTYPGMPGFVEAEGAALTIFFRLMGRSAEVATLIAIASRMTLPGAPRVWLLAGLGTCGVIGWLGNVHLDWFPELIRNRQPTEFKTAYEYLLGALNAGAALALWRAAVRTGSQRFYLLSCSCVVMASGSFVLAQYRSPSDFTFIFGQLFKFAGYALVYRAAFVYAIQEPHRLLQESEHQLRELNVELEQRVAQRTAALTQANRSLESFSYMIAHDLRAPLRNIDGYSSLLKQGHDQQLNDEGRQLLEGIHNSIDSMYRLIDIILATSRLEHAPLHISRTDLSALASQITTELKLSEPQRKIEVIIEPGLQADADPVLIRNVLTNLLSNAWKFTASQSAGRIEVGALNQVDAPHVDHDGNAVFFVRDNGIGFEPDAADRLFNLFQRHPGHMHVAGHGIGLASVRSIITNHGGKVWAEGATGQGATFYFSLPILQQPTTTSSQLNAALSNQTRAGPLRC